MQRAIRKIERTFSGSTQSLSPSRAYRLAAAVRSTPPHRVAGSGAQRFIAASLICVIRRLASALSVQATLDVVRVSVYSRRLRNEYERATLPGVRSRTPPAGVLVTAQCSSVRALWGARLKAGTTYISRLKPGTTYG